MVIMGMSINYCSTGSLSDEQVTSIQESAETLNAQWTWLGCEPVHFHRIQRDGQMEGGSKMNFEPHGEDLASAEAEGLPIAYTRHLFMVLCELSRDHLVDWRVSMEEATLGYVRGGRCDDTLSSAIEGFAAMEEGIRGFNDDIDSDQALADPFNGDDRDDDDDEPRILKFRPL
jgi:hypothetical protein